MLRPLERFLHVEAASGLVLLVAAVAAVTWANSPWAWAYEALWHTPLVVGVGDLVSRQTLHFWINEGLMTIFFFVIGLEIRRELHGGELADAKRAALPVVAALGGMIAPALLYLVLNRAPEVRHGWGVATATDIAFAVGALALLGKRVAPALRVLLLALAIIDDIGAIVLIAVFYSGGVGVVGLAVAAGGAVLVVIWQRLGIRRTLAYVAPGVVIWGGLLHAGVHPTIAGVALGLMTPARPWYGREGFVTAATEAIRDFRDTRRRGDASQAQEPLRRIAEARREALPPVERLQLALHPWVAYGVMPIFALANAGVSLRGLDLAHAGSATVLLGVLVGLVLGKPIGIVGATALAVRLRICALPRGVDWRGVLAVGCVAGIGFTMAIFIAGLAFRDPVQLAAAKLAVLASSAAAALLGMAVGRLLLARGPASGAALTLEEAETSADR
jgi:NhaA family Na+:H+ antiporter